MKCFYIFKDKSKKKKGDSRSAPELGNRSTPDTLPLSRTTRSLPSPRSITELYKEKEHNLRVFSFEELREATNGFNRLLKIGEGGFGSVYKGTIRPADGQVNSIPVAIKKLNKYGLQVRTHICVFFFYLYFYSSHFLILMNAFCSIIQFWWISFLEILCCIHFCYFHFQLTVTQMAAKFDLLSI